MSVLEATEEGLWHRHFTDADAAGRRLAGEERAARRRGRPEVRTVWQMNVLWLTNMWPDTQRPWYGAFVHSQARSLERIGVNLDVLYVPGYRSSWEYARGAKEVFRRSKRQQYELVHAHYGHSGVFLDCRRRLRCCCRTVATISWGPRGRTV